MNFSFVFKLYFSSASNNVQLNYKFLSCISHFLSTSKLVVPCVSSRTHPKKYSKGREKSLCDLERARPKKMCLHPLEKKNGGRGQKIEK